MTQQRRAKKTHRTKERPTMKLLKTTVAVALFAAASAGTAFADASHAGRAGHGMHQPGERIVKILNLDANRAAQVTAIMTEQRAQGKALWEANKGNTDRDAKHAQMKALRDATHVKLATVLTPAEMTQLQDARAKHGHQARGAKQS
jgi:hypothetical protein